VRTRIVILEIICLCALVSNACERVGSTPQGQRSAESNSTNSRGASHNSDAYEPPVRLAQLEDRAINESSGIVASRRNPDLFWTHNDSGDGPTLYALDRKGRSRGRWRVSGAQAVDWEDIAIGPGPQPGISYLYIGDIGDNDSERESITVYRVVEPSLTGEGDSATGNSQHTTEAAEAIRLKYPDGKHDAEALLVHPSSGDLYVITKTFDATSGIYKLKAPFSGASVNTLSSVGKIGAPSLIGGLITGGDIAPDGRRVVLCDYLDAYEMSLPETAASDFDNIWTQPLAIVELGTRKQGESVCYSLDGNAILATSERRPTPLIEVKRKTESSRQKAEGGRRKAVM
jgi:hypothetical protein